MGGEIGRPSKEGGMAEGQKPRIAEQQVERACEEREAQDLHQEDRIDEERREQQENDARRAENHLRAAEPFLRRGGGDIGRSEEHTSELQSLMRISYAVFCLKKKKKTITRRKN